MTTLFEPTQIGDIAVANRIVMAPLTRNRAGAGHTASPLSAIYYAQRASAGLIVSEGTQIRPDAQGYLDTPGIHTPQQVAAWRQVTDAVHAAGGKIVAQLWHVGRISHSDLIGGMAPVSPTTTRANTQTFVSGGFAPTSAPRALHTDEIPGLVADFAQAARRAMEAGFDGVEVHGANGYLIEQFLRDSVNDRTDRYGGDLDARTQLLVEVMQAIVSAIGAGRTGLRLSPVTPVNDCAQDSHPQALYEHAVRRLAPLQLAFLHIIEGQTGGPRDIAPFNYDALHALYKAAHPAGTWMVNNGYDRSSAMEAVSQGRADVVSFGKAFVANPDLVRRLKDDAPLNPLRPKLLYGGGAEGYTDYPALTD